MHSAPSVSYPVGRSRFAGVLMSCAWLAGAGVGAMWMRQLPAPGWRMAAMGVALLATGGFAVWSWLRMARGELSWDGQAWAWNAGATAWTGNVAVMLDLQRALLLQWRGTDGSLWLWIDRGSRETAWRDVRRAVYSRARPEASPQPRPAAPAP